ncbi:hypothetical protein GCM10010301_70390 [Streptomyces plicatus]|nr:hypothetical protein GCM10010301_70390 [Streptomyces plicatus]
MPGARFVRGPVGEDEAAQQVQARGFGQSQGGPERRSELAPAAGLFTAALRDAVGEQAQHVRVGRGVGHAGEHLGEQPGGPPRARVGVEGGHQLFEGQGELGDAVLAGEEQQGLRDGADAVVGHGEGVRVVRGSALVHEGAQGFVQVEVGALDPVGQFLVGEAVAVARRDEESFGEYGRRPAGAAAETCGGRPPREDRLERLPVQLALAGGEAAPGRLVHLPGDLRREPAYGGAAQAVLLGQSGGDAQAHQVEVGREDRVPVDPDGWRDAGQRLVDLGEQAEGEGVPGVRVGEGAFRQPVAGPCLSGLAVGQVAEADAGRVSATGGRRRAACGHGSGRCGGGHRPGQAICGHGSGGAGGGHGSGGAGGGHGSGGAGGRHGSGGAGGGHGSGRITGRHRSAGADGRRSSEWITGGHRSGGDCDGHRPGRRPRGCRDSRGLGGRPSAQGVGRPRSGRDACGPCPGRETGVPRPGGGVDEGRPRREADGGLPGRETDGPRPGPDTDGARLDGPSVDGPSVDGCPRPGTVTLVGVRPRPRLPCHGRPRTAGGKRRPGPRLGRCARPVQHLARELRPRPLPVLGPTGHHEPGTRLGQPGSRALGPLGETVGQDGRHLLGAVEEEQERASGVLREPGEAFRCDVAEAGRAGTVGGGDDAGGPGQRPARRVRHRHVVVVQIGAAQPQGGRGLRAPGPTGGEGCQLGGTAAAGGADQAQDAGAGVEVREGGELPHHLGAFHGRDRLAADARPPHRARTTTGAGPATTDTEAALTDTEPAVTDTEPAALVRTDVDPQATAVPHAQADPHAQAGVQTTATATAPADPGSRDRRPSPDRHPRRAVLPHLGRGEGEHAGQIEVGAVGRDGRGVLGEQVGEGAGCGRQRDGEADVAVSGAERGAEDGEDRAGRQVEDRTAGRAPAQPQGVPSRRADGEFQRVGEAVEAVGGRVVDVGGAQDPGLPPAGGGDPDIGPGLDPLPRGDGQRGHAEAPFGTHQGQTEGGQRGHVGGGHDAAATAGGAQHEPGQAVDRLVTGDDGATVVGDESGAARAAGEVVEADQGVVGRGSRRLALPGPRSGAPFPGTGPGSPCHPAAPRLPGPVPRRHRRTSPPYTRAVRSTVGA